MVVNIQIEGAPKTLDQRDCASPCRGFGVTGFAGHPLASPCQYPKQIPAKK